MGVRGGHHDIRVGLVLLDLEVLDVFCPRVEHALFLVEVEVINAAIKREGRSRI